MQHDPAGRSLEADIDPRSLRVARDVRQALLRDTVDHELFVVVEPRQARTDDAVDADARLLAEAGDERRERADEPQVVERLRTQLAGDVTDVVEALTRRVLRFHDIGLEFGGSPVREPLEQQHDSGERLADLVVELARDSLPFRLLRRKSAPAALAPLALEPVEHLVEDPDELAYLGGPGDGESMSRREEVDTSHRARETLQRSERATDEQQIDHQDREQSREEQDRLGRRDRQPHGCRGQGENGRSDEKHGRVQGEDAPEQGHTLVL